MGEFKKFFDIVTRIQSEEVFEMDSPPTQCRAFKLGMWASCLRQVREHLRLQLRELSKADVIMNQAITRARWEWRFLFCCQAEVFEGAFSAQG